MAQQQESSSSSGGCNCFGSNERSIEPVDSPRAPVDPVITQPKPENTVNENYTATPEKPVVIQPKPIKPVNNNNKPKPNAVLTHGNLRERANQLKAEKVDLHKPENRKAHKTDEYEIKKLILRRGQAFEVTVTFNREFSPQADVIILQFVTGDDPQENKGGIERVKIRDELVSSKWGMQVKQTNGNTVRLLVMPSVNAAIGYYELMVETKSKDSSGDVSLYRYKHEEEQICILFNAWCQDDVVYMEKNDDLELDPDEYVLRESGSIWRGSWKRFFGFPWNFGQFDDAALNSALFLLKKAGLSVTAMSNVIHVVRKMTHMVNSTLLEGNWGDPEDFEDGTAPWEWSGSIAILEQFWKEKDIVKYGQCWVFSGIITSLLRALGIPTRSVTNFESAHDTDSSLTIDYHFDADGRPDTSYNEDSVWNYHVWNECWFKRVDLPDGHDGWQAIDGTPQEESGGFYQCGPASVNAIKNGEVYLNYDTGFIFAEVNADKVYWEVPFLFSGEMRAIQTDKMVIGKNISTLKPGTNGERQDITRHYKHPEGSEKERSVVEFVNRFSSKADLEIYETAVKDVTKRLEIADEVKFGEDFKATAFAKNESNERRTVTSYLTAILVFYTGKAARTLKEAKNTVVLEPGEEKGATLEISTAELIGKSAAEASIKVFLKGTVEETDQRFAIQDVVEFKKPGLNLTASSTSPKLNEKVTVTVSIHNPLPIDLTKGKFHFESRLKPKTHIIPCDGPVRANETKEVTATFQAAERPGYRNLTVTFNSQEITGVSGNIFFYVEE